MCPSSNKLRLAAAPTVYLAILLCGCSRQGEFVEVVGKVTMNDQPLAGVNVTFYPDTEGNEPAPFARGQTDGAGNYTLATGEGQTGVLAGKYRVVVSWPPGDRAAKGPPRPDIPLKYTVALDTPLIYELKAGEPQTINLVLLP
jgi:hypothetical protein